MQPTPHDNLTCQNAREVASLRKRVRELESAANERHDEAVAMMEERAEKAERERDSYRRDFDATAHACDKLQADLDAALHCLGATRLDRTRPGVEEAWAHIRPRPEKYWREDRG